MFSSEFMRPEVWHALTVHFPIALLPVATITTLISFFVNERMRPHWQMAATLLVLAGCVMAWVAVYTGGIADGVVARKICDPTVLKDHELASETMTWIFTGAAITMIVLSTRALPFSLNKPAALVALLLMLTGTGYLVYAGHVGATLVYEQGAGVRNHSVDCSEYE